MMSLGINYSLFSLLILLRSQIILGISVAVTSDKTVCVDNNITVTCSIDPFTTPPSATWNRNGTVLTTCTSGGICTTDSMEISGIKYSFFGISNGIQVSLQVQPGENDIQWTCNHNSITYPYTFRVLNECPKASTNFESSPIIESTSTSFFVESNAGISPTDESQLNTLNIFSVSSDPPTTLFSSMTDTITETVSSTYDDKVILLTSSEQMLLVTSSLNTLGAFTSGMENSVLSTESFVKIISRSFSTSSSSLDTFSPKITTPIQHGLSESTKDDIFISAVSGMIGAIIFVVLIATFISRFIMNRNKSKDEKDDEISNQCGWSDDSGMNSYNKNYTSREYPFNSASSIHFPLHSYESPYFSYANNYKKNWNDNT